MVIVGGGITGSAAALLFARAGASVILVESQRLGRGSTAASTALLMQEPDVDFRDLARRYGARTARRIWTASRVAVGSMRRMLAAVGAPRLHSLPSMYFTRDVSAVAGLRQESLARRRAGLPARWLDERAVARLSGLSAAGAILTPGNAQVDPYAACLAFAAAAHDSGARIYERSSVTRISGSRDGVSITVGRARIDADYAVVATGYATSEFKPLAGRFRMMNTYVIATPRLTAAERRRVGLGDMMLWDTDRPYHYLRWTADERLLFGGLDRPRVPGRTRPAVLRRQADRLTEQLIELYPSLNGMRPEYAWEGLFANTPDGLPYIGAHRRYPRHLFALGYGGNGMTLGYLAAEMVVRMAAGTHTADDQLFGFGRTRKRITSTSPSSRP